MTLYKDFVEQSEEVPELKVSAVGTATSSNDDAEGDDVKLHFYMPNEYAALMPVQKRKK